MTPNNTLEQRPKSSLSIRRWAIDISTRTVMSASSSLQWTEAVEFVKNRDAELRRLPYDQLALLPSFGEAALVADSRWKKIQVYVYVDKMPKGRLRVIAQAWRLYVLGFSKSHTEGFEVERDGGIEPLDPNGSWW